ncbi:MAG TPA: hypothetical protein VGJ21_21745 [Terracidiphilus sp.]|jgi:hypothetical protein
MQLVIRVDLDTSKQSLPEIFRLIANCDCASEGREEAAPGSSGSILDHRAQIIGEWEIEEAEDTKRPVASESSYRAAAIARYAQPSQIEVDRFATVSLTHDGAYVQGWLHVPQTDIVSGDHEQAPSRKPPQSVLPIDKADRRVG